MHLKQKLRYKMINKKSIKILIFSFLIITNITGIISNSILGINLDSNSSLYIIPQQVSEQMTQSIEWVTMRDGVRLYTEVFLPNDLSESEILPAILMRSLYPTDWGWINAFQEHSCSFRWAIILQNTRGSYNSEGEFSLFLNETTDTYDTIQWIINQDWSNGNVGMHGISALGVPELLVHRDQPDPLKAEYISFTSSDIYQDLIYPGGALNKGFLEQWFGLLGQEVLFEDIYEHENFSSYWEELSLKNKYNLVSSPSIFVGGWYDGFLRGTIADFMGYQYETNSSIRGKSKLIIGPWGHFFPEDNSRLGDITFPDNYYISLEPFWNELFLEYLKEEENNLNQIPTVIYYCMGPTYNGATGNFWRTTDLWPIPVNYTKYYLHENNLLTLDLPLFDEGSDDILYNPINPVPTVGGNILFDSEYGGSGPRDQLCIESRDDIILFTSNNLTTNLEITGNITAKLWISSNCSDTDFTVKLTDIYPNGTSMLIQDDIKRAKYRVSQDTPILLNSGEIVPIEIDLWSTSYIFNINHKIRIAVSSSNYPRYNANPNTGDPINKNTTYYIANNSIYHNSDYPSHIILPININSISTENYTWPPSFPITEPPPGIPKGLIATVIDSSRIDLNWYNNQELNIDHYNIYRSLSIDGDYQYIDQTSSNFYSDINLELDTLYFYKISALNTYGKESLKSVFSSARTGTPSSPNKIPGFIMLLPVAISSFIVILRKIKKKNKLFL